MESIVCVSTRTQATCKSCQEIINCFYTVVYGYLLVNLYVNILSSKHSKYLSLYVCEIQSIIIHQNVFPILLEI